MKSYQKILTSIVAIGLLMLAFIVLQQINSNLPQDESILSQNPCSFPCWHGIIPGETSRAEVQKIVKTDPFITSAGNLQEGTDGLGRTVLRWWHDRPQRQNRILLEDSSVYSIEIVPNIEFTLEDIIDEFGNPNALNAWLERASEGGRIDIQLFLYYPQIGAEIEFKIEGGDVLTTKQFDISPNTPGVSFKLYRPQESIMDFVSEIYSLEEPEINWFMENLTTEWPGFNAIVLLNPDWTSFYDATVIVTRTPD